DYLKARWILSPSTWLLYRLCIREGEIWDDVCTDWTNALKFGVDLTQSPPAWHTPIFQETGVSVNLLPKIVPCGSEIGRAESRLAEKIGLRGARIFQGMTDGNASALAVGCLKESDFGFSCGTTTAVKYVCNSMKVHNAIYYHKHPFEGYLAGAAPITAGILDWFAKKVIGIPIEDAFRMAERMPPETECQFYPQGDRSPFNDPKLGASFLGIWPDEASLDETRGRLFRSIVVGLTFFEYYYIQLFETLFDSKIEEVRITGGGTRTPWWNDLRASVYGLPVKVLEERPGIGALIPAVVRLRLLSLEEVTKKLLRVLAVHAPDERLKEKYEDRRKAFLKKWEKLREAYSLQ
ncbi:MAG: FGGY-family carbohydrate kinase, partial [Candidatus Bathyarchaeia archaeon]